MAYMSSDDSSHMECRRTQGPPGFEGAAAIVYAVIVSCLAGACFGLVSILAYLVL